MLQAAAFEQQRNLDLQDITILRVLSSIAVHAEQHDTVQLEGALAVRLSLHAAWKSQQLEVGPEEIALMLQQGKI